MTISYDACDPSVWTQIIDTFSAHPLVGPREAPDWSAESQRGALCRC